MSYSPNESIVERAAGGDREAMAEIVREHYAAIFRFCARRVGPDLAADAAQDTFVSAQRSIRGFAGHSSLSTWLFGIANNHCRSLARKRKMEVDYAYALEKPTGEDASAIVNREALRTGLLALSKEHREVIVLHELDGLTYDEAAEVLGVPSGTVKSRLHHGFLHLRRILGGAA